jgi:hypothetical protein
MVEMLGEGGSLTEEEKTLTGRAMVNSNRGFSTFFIA